MLHYVPLDAQSKSLFVSRKTGEIGIRQVHVTRYRATQTIDSQPPGQLQYSAGLKQCIGWSLS